MEVPDNGFAIMENLKMEDRLLDPKQLHEYLQEIKYNPADRIDELDRLLELWQFQQRLSKRWKADEAKEKRRIAKFRMQLIKRWQK